MSKPICISTVDLEFFQHSGVTSKVFAFMRIAEEEGFSPFFITPSLKLHRTVKRQLCRKVAPPMQRAQFQGYPCFQFAARYPELEQNSHYFDRSSVQSILSKDIPCFAVSGNNHAARPYLDLNIPFSIWIASTFWEERKYQILQAPWSSRKVLDLLTRQSCEKLESRIFETSQAAAIDTTYIQREALKINPCIESKLRLIPIPVNCDFYRPAPSPEPAHFLFIGRLHDPRKNLNLLLGAFTLFTRNHSKGNLVLVGSGSSVVEQQLKKHPASQRIIRKNRISESEKLELLQNAIALVVASFQEGFGIAATEAMACGVPVISTPCGGTQDFVIQNETGFLLKNFDPKEMAEALSQVARDFSLQKQLGIKAREFAKNHLSFEAIRPKLKQFIHAGTDSC